MDKTKLAIFSRLTIWKHIKYKTKDALALTVTIPPLTNAYPLPQDFLELLLSSLPDSDPKRKHLLNNLHNANRIFTYYLKGEKNIDNLYGFVLQNPEANSLIKQRSISGQLKTKHEINRANNWIKSHSRANSLEVVEQKHFVLKNINNSEIPIITVKPCEFTVLSDLAKHILNTYNNYKKTSKPKLSQNPTRIYNLVRYLKAIFSTDPKDKKYQCKSCYGWAVEMID